jgi:hypothetical protein
MSCELRLLIKTIAHSSSKHHLLQQSCLFDSKMRDGTILHAMKYIDALQKNKENYLLLDLQTDEGRIFFLDLWLGFDLLRLCKPRRFAGHQRFNFWDIDNLSDCKNTAVQRSTDAAAHTADAAADEAAEAAVAAAAAAAAEAAEAAAAAEAAEAAEAAAAAEAAEAALCLNVTYAMCDIYIRFYHCNKSLL